MTIVDTRISCDARTHIRADEGEERTSGDLRRRGWQVGDAEGA